MALTHRTHTANVLVIGTGGAGLRAAIAAHLAGYLSTLRKQGVAVLAALETVCAGHPLDPTFV